jgi:hypothetical protein
MKNRMRGKFGEELGLLKVVEEAGEQRPRTRDAEKA